MGHFGVALLSDEVRALLGENETPIAFEFASMMGSADRTGKHPKTRLYDGFSWDPVLGGIQAEDGYFESKIAGVGAEGPEGSMGSALLEAIGTGASLLLTTDRLMVVEQYKPRVRFQVPRSELIGVRAVPRFGQLGRLELSLRDGSRVRPMLGMIWPAAARRFRRAFRTGQPQS